MAKKKKPVGPREAAKQRIIDDITCAFWERYPPEKWSPSVHAMGEEPNPFVLVMVAKHCLNLARYAMERLKDFPRLDDIWPDPDYKGQVEEIWGELIEWAEDQTTESE